MAQFRTLRGMCQKLSGALSCRDVYVYTLDLLHQRESVSAKSRPRKVLAKQLRGLRSLAPDELEALELSFDHEELVNTKKEPKLVSVDLRKASPALPWQCTPRRAFFPRHSTQGIGADL